MKRIAGFFLSRMFIVFALIGVQVIFLAVSFNYFETQSRVVHIVLFVISIIMTFYILNRTENPSYKLAWIIPILILPPLGILLYVFFRQRKPPKKMRKRSAAVDRCTARVLTDNPQLADKLEQKDAAAFRQSEYILRSTGCPAFGHTQTEYFPMGEDFFKKLLEELNKAEKYIFMEYFIVNKGEMWGEILSVLERKVKAGVDVRFMYDDIGCAQTLPIGYAKKLRQKGIKCEVFNKLKPELSSIFNNRDHKKITSIDGRTAFCGGSNLADEYINAIHRFGVWKDANIMLKGKGAWALTLLFLKTWEIITMEDTDYSVFAPDEESFSRLPENGCVQVYSDNPLKEEDICENVYLNMIDYAVDYIYINTPYLILDRELVKSLTKAAQNGVDVRITTPHIPDKKIVFLLTRANYNELIKSGVKIYEYTPGFIHSKTFVCDDKYAIVSTVNLDYRSMFLNYECGVWMYDTSCVQPMKEDYLQTQEICTPVTKEDIANRKSYIRFLQSFFKIFSPLI